MLRLIAADRGRGACSTASDLARLLGAAHCARAARDVQIIFQDPYASLNPRMRVAEILEEGMTCARRRRRRAATRARASTRCWTQVGLPPEVEHRAIRTNSPAASASASRSRARLAVEPRLIVCDEPTSALDVSVQAQILNLLK